jgi:hypothetical protein
MYWHQQALYCGIDDGHQCASTSSNEPNKFWLLINSDKFKEVMLYGELLAYIIKAEDVQEVLWHYQAQEPTVSYDVFMLVNSSIHPHTKPLCESPDVSCPTTASEKQLLLSPWFHAYSWGE